tara:strand:- start:3221 stop:3838 length:618 start_codon:yes stop_codon:yes gene_type:complete
MPVEGRYNRIKRRRKQDDAIERFTPSAMWSDSRAEICRAAVNSVDAVARELEMKWGIGKLEELAPPNLAVKFEQARQNFSEACHLDDSDYLVQKANNLITGWRKLETTAIEAGHKPGSAEVWYGIAPPDCGEYNFAIVKWGSDAAAIDRDKYPIVYTLDEVCRIIKSFQQPLVEAAKKEFKDSKIINIKTGGDLNDPIPFGNIID